MSDQPQQFLLMRPHEPVRQPMPTREIVVPPRVNKAIEVLSFFTHKTAAPPVCNEIGIEIVAGQKLSGAEVAVCGAACDVLTDYFSGRLKLDEWEQSRRENDRKRRSKAKKTVMVIANCPECKGVAGLRCGLCEGDGNVAVVRRSAVM